MTSPDWQSRCTAHVGRSRESADTLSAEPVNRLLATLDDERALADGDPLPPLFHWMYFEDPVRSDALDPDGHERLGPFLPPVPYPRRMWAGSDVTFHRPLAIGREATRRSTIASVAFKSGASGPLCFVVVEHAVHQGGEHCLTDRQTIVYREASSASGEGNTGGGAGGDAGERGEPRPSTESPAAGGDGTADDVRSLNSTVLFRYSAVTFNSHRIHFDRDYARDEEGYPGLVVHGPLMATLLMRHASAAEPSRTPSAFRFRARSPLFDGEGFRIDADGTDAGLALELVKTDGTPVASADVEWR